MQEVVGQSSFYSANDRRLHFGLGAETTVDLAIRWTNGTTETIAKVAADQQFGQDFNCARVPKKTRLLSPKPGLRVGAKCAQQTSTRLIGIAPISWQSQMHVKENIATARLAKTWRHTQKPPRLSACTSGDSFANRTVKAVNCPLYVREQGANRCKTTQQRRQVF